MMQITSRTIIAEDLPDLTPEQKADLQRRAAKFQERLFARLVVSIFPAPRPCPPTPPCPDCRGRVIMCLKCMSKVA